MTPSDWCLNLLCSIANLSKTQDTLSKDKTGCLLQWKQHSLCSCSQTSCLSTGGITAPYCPERISGQLLPPLEVQMFGRIIDFPLCSRINWAVCSEVVSAPCCTHISSVSAQFWADSCQELQEWIHWRKSSCMQPNQTWEERDRRTGWEDLKEKQDMTEMTLACISGDPQACADLTES